MNNFDFFSSRPAVCEQRLEVWDGDSELLGSFCSDDIKKKIIVPCVERERQISMYLINDNTDVRFVLIFNLAGKNSSRKYDLLRCIPIYTDLGDHTGKELLLTPRILYIITYIGQLICLIANKSSLSVFIRISCFFQWTLSSRVK